MIIKMKNNGTLLPIYMSKGAAGFDICSLVGCILSPNETVLIPTGLLMEIPECYELQIRSRSGLAFKGIIVLNSPATIDSDFRGEIKVMLHNMTDKTFAISKGDRIAQGVLAPVIQAIFELVDELSSTERGSGGFGSTGV